MGMAELQQKRAQSAIEMINTFDIICIFEFQNSSIRFKMLDT
jgi:hypothetical protein